MNWEALQALAELVAAAGVIISLGYVGLQVRQNTASVQASTVVRASEVLNRIRSSVWTDPEAARIYLLALSGEPATGPSDAARARMFFLAIARDYEAVYYQHQSGQLPNEIWEAWRGEMLLIFGTPGGMDAAKGLREEVLSSDFYAFLRHEVDQLAGSPLHVLRARWERIAEQRRGESPHDK